MDTNMDPVVDKKVLNPENGLESVGQQHELPVLQVEELSTVRPWMNDFNMEGSQQPLVGECKDSKFTEASTCFTANFAPNKFSAETTEVQGEMAYQFLEGQTDETDMVLESPFDSMTSKL